MRSLLLLLAFALPVSVLAQGGTEIYLLDMKINKNRKVTVSDPVNITNHKGYDSQPFFHQDKPLIYYASTNDSGRTDIRVYNYETRITTNLTNTREREYSPTLTPDGKFISCIIQRDNGAQDLGKYPVNGGEPTVLIDHLTIGYHAWVDHNSLLLFVLDDSAHNSLHYYNLVTKKDTILSRSPGRSLHKTYGHLSMIFVEKTADSNHIIKMVDNKQMIPANITKTLKGREDLASTAAGIMMSDGSQLFVYRNGEYRWEKVKSPALKGVTRLAVNRQNTKLAIVVTE